MAAYGALNARTLHATLFRPLQSVSKLAYGLSRLTSSLAPCSSLQELFEKAIELDLSSFSLDQLGLLHSALQNSKVCSRSGPFMSVFAGVFASHVLCERV